MAADKFLIPIIKFAHSSPRAIDFRRAMYILRMPFRPINVLPTRRINTKAQETMAKIVPWAADNIHNQIELKSKN